MSQTSVSPSTIRRVLLLGLVGAAYGAICWNPHWMARLGVTHAGLWFLDMHAVLASSDAHALGLNPYLPNPLDFLRQPHVYSDWWFALHTIGLGRADYLWLGAALGFTFLAVGILLSGVRTTREVLWSAAILTAPPMILGFNRGNADLLLFLIVTTAVPCLRSHRSALRWAGAGLLLLATGLKFYPAVAGIVLLGCAKSKREFFTQTLAFTLATVVIVIENHGTLSHYTADTASPVAFDVIGVDVTAQLFGLPHTAVLATAIVVFAIAGVVSWRRAPAWPLGEERTSETTRFILGAALILGCYFVTVSYTYRLIYAVLLGPLLWSATHSNQWLHWYRRLGRAGCVLLLVQLWLNGLVRVCLTGPHAPVASEVTRWSVRLLATEQVTMAALSLVLAGFVLTWIRDRARALAAAPVAG